jgi:hypothetical protein
MASEWITALAADERKRDDERSRIADAAARKADLVRQHGRRLIDDLRMAVERDLDMFRAEFPGDTAREVIFETVQPDGGFVIRKQAYPIAALSITPHLPAGSVTCEYQFTPANGLPPREDRVEFLLTGNGGDTLKIRHPGTGHVFTDADSLSEFLLVPVLTGRPR